MAAPIEMPFEAATALACTTSPADKRYVIVRSAPDAVTVSIVGVADLMAAMLAAILVATCAAVSPLATDVDAPNALKVPTVEIPLPVMAAASATSPKVLR